MPNYELSRSQVTQTISVYCVGGPNNDATFLIADSFDLGVLPT